MSMVACLSRLQFITRALSDLSVTMQQISQNKIMLLNNSALIGQRQSELFGSMGQYGMDNQYVKQAQQEMDNVLLKINMYEKIEDTQMNTLDTQYKALNNEKESVQKMLDDAIKASKPNISLN
jgi:hypothetical protein